MAVMSSFTPAFDVRGAGREMADNVARGQEIAARHKHRKALDTYNELPAYDPEAMNQTPEGFVGPPEVDAGRAWEEHVERQLAAARGIDPALELQLRPILQEQHRHMASLAVSQAGFYAGTNQVEQAQQFADRFTQLMAPGTGFRVTAESQLPDPDKPEGPDNRPGVVFRGPDGQPVDINFLTDALGKAFDPMEWERSKAWMASLAARAESDAATAAARMLGDGPEIDRLDNETVLKMSQEAVGAIAEGGMVPDTWMSRLSTADRNRWFRNNEIAKPFRMQWESATAEMFRTMGPEGVSSPYEAAHMGFLIAAAVEGDAGAGAVPLVYARGRGIRPGDHGPSDVLIITMPDGAEAALGWESPMAKRLRTKYSLNPDDGRLPAPAEEAEVPPEGGDEGGEVETPTTRQKALAVPPSAPEYIPFNQRTAEDTNQVAATEIERLRSEIAALESEVAQQGYAGVGQSTNLASLKRKLRQLEGQRSRALNVE